MLAPGNNATGCPGGAKKRPSVYFCALDYISNTFLRILADPKRAHPWISSMDVSTPMVLRCSFNLSGIVPKALITMHGQKLRTVWPLSMRITDGLWKCLTLIRICKGREKFLKITLNWKGISYLHILCAKFWGPYSFPLGSSRGKLRQRHTTVILISPYKHCISAKITNI